MTIFFSHSTVGFYTPDVNPVIPEDAVEITEVKHAALMVGQTLGYEIVAGEDGQPTLRGEAPLSEQPAEELPG